MKGNQGYFFDKSSPPPENDSLSKKFARGMKKENIPSKKNECEIVANKS